jgi:hypothetical protein
VSGPDGNQAGTNLSGCKAARLAEAALLAELLAERGGWELTPSDLPVSDLLVAEVTG